MEYDIGNCLAAIHGSVAAGDGLRSDKYFWQIKFEIFILYNFANITLNVIISTYIIARIPTLP